MKSRRPLAMLACCLAAAVSLLSLGSRGEAVSAAVPSARRGEAIVLSGAQISGFLGAAAQDLWVFSWQAGAWREVPCQLDERDSRELFVAREDGALDYNDELVFLADHLGDLAPEVSWPAGLDRAWPRMHLSVSDPLAGSFQGHAYVFRSAAGTRGATEIPVAWDSASDEVVSSVYTVGYARQARDGFIGVRRLAIAGVPGDNLLDRLKIRARIDTGTIPLVLTEQDLGGVGVDLVPEPIASGPVRLVLDAMGTAMAYPRRMHLMPSLAGFAMPGLLPVNLVRVSIDLSAMVTGTYQDANMAAPVPIDGSPDSVPDGPLPGWREVDLGGARMVLLSAPDDGAAATVYYLDDRRISILDTGDRSSRGDQGVQASSVEGFVASGFPGEMVVVPDGEAGASAAELAQAKARPLRVSVSGGPPTPTRGPATATRPASPTWAIPTGMFTPGWRPTRTPSATPTAPGGTARLCLPRAVKHR